MTLQELKELVKEANRQEMPSARSLKNRFDGVVLRRDICGDTELRVYDQGYVFYRIDDHMTVFALADVIEDYYYDSAMEMGHYVSDCCADCIYRLVIEGEDRIMRNTDTIAQRNQISYSAVSEEWDAIEDPYDAIAGLIDELAVRDLLDYLTERQKEILIRYFFEELQTPEIGGELGISKQAVSDSIRASLKKLKNKI